MKGKDKCKILKELRAQIAAANDIEWVTENCSHKGECRGTCPKCEAEVATLERALERRRALGKTVALTGLAVGMIATTTACSEFDQWQVRDGDIAEPARTSQTSVKQALTGDMVIEDEKATVPAQTTTERIEVDVDGVPAPEFMGEPALIYYFSDFTLFESRTFKSTGRIYFERVEDGDGNLSSDREISEGVRFEVVGEMDYYWLVSYEDSYYCVWKDDLDERAVEIQIVDASDDSAAEIGE